jgi:hypothetical protein
MIKVQFSRLALVTVCTLLLLITGCSETIDVQLEPKVDAYLVTDSKRAISLVETDAAHIQLNTWLKENRTNWHATSGRYPGGVYLKSGVDGIQVTGMNVVVYSTKGPEPEAKYIRHVGKLELSEVRAIGQ